MNKNQLQIMLEMQDNFNKQVNPEWRNAEYRWADAIMVEAVELLEHFGWKWWKKQTMDFKQCQMELIDIWHFIMSDMMISLEDNEDICKVMQSALKESCEVKNTETDDEVRHRIRCLVMDASSNDLYYETLTNFTALLKLFGINEDLLFKLYIGKNALNKFRQDNGYKQGTYVKEWSLDPKVHKEDNEVLFEILDRVEVEDASTFFETVYTELGNEYVKLFEEVEIDD